MASRLSPAVLGQFTCLRKAPRIHRRNLGGGGAKAANVLPKYFCTYEEFSLGYRVEKEQIKMRVEESCVCILKTGSNQTSTCFYLDSLFNYCSQYPWSILPPSTPPKNIISQVKPMLRVVSKWRHAPMGEGWRFL